MKHCNEKERSNTIFSLHISNIEWPKHLAAPGFSGHRFGYLHILFSTILRLWVWAGNNNQWLLWEAVCQKILFIVPISISLVSSLKVFFFKKIFEVHRLFSYLILKTNKYFFFLQFLTTHGVVLKVNNVTLFLQKKKNGKPI